MDHSKVVEIVNANIKQMRWAMQLQDWTINLTYGPLEAGNAGTCMADPKRCRAEIEIDPAALKDEAAVLDTLRHELLHILHAGYETYRSAVSHLLSADVFRTLDEVMSLGSESLVARLERMLDHGLKVGTKVMCVVRDEGTG